jgi:hypothetical protein
MRGQGKCIGAYVGANVEYNRLMASIEDLYAGMDCAPLKDSEEVDGEIDAFVQFKVPLNV